jgi:hypothetical protein
VITARSADREPRHAALGGRAQVVGQHAGQRLEIRGTAAHQPLDRGHDGLRAVEKRGTGRLADLDRLAIGDDRGKQRAPLLVAQHLDLAVARDGDDRIGGAEIDADRKAALAFMRQRRLAGLVDVQQQHRPQPSPSSRACRARASSTSF